MSKPQWDKPSSIATDASNVGIGAVLFQGTRDNPRYIVCVSRALSPSERNYSATKKELLGIIFALRKLKFYVAGRRFTVFTDHKALTHMFTQKKLNDMLERWLDELLDFTFDVEHLPGIANVLPDCLSRLYSVSEASDSDRPTILLAHADSAVVPPSVSDDSRVAASASRGLPVEIWRDSSLIPGSVVVSRQQCWLEPECVDALEGGDAGGDDEDFLAWALIAGSTESAEQPTPLPEEVTLDELPSDSAIPLLLTKLGDHAEVTPVGLREEALANAHSLGHRGSRGTLHRLLTEEFRWPCIEKDCLRGDLECLDRQR